MISCRRCGAACAAGRAPAQQSAPPPADLQGGEGRGGSPDILVGPLFEQCLPCLCCRAAGWGASLCCARSTSLPTRKIRPVRHTTQPLPPIFLAGADACIHPTIHPIQPTWGDEGAVRHVGAVQQLKLVQDEVGYVRLAGLLQVAVPVVGGAWKAGRAGRLDRLNGLSGTGALGHYRVVRAVARHPTPEELAQHSFQFTTVPALCLSHLLQLANSTCWPCVPRCKTWSVGLGARTQTAPEGRA